MDFYKYPVPHVVWDDFIAVPSGGFSTPDPSRPDQWEVAYENDCERGKRTTRTLPPWASVVLDKMYSRGVLDLWQGVLNEPVRPDATVHGGGLQVTLPGGHLNCHLDGVLHPSFPDTRRAVQMVCYCHPEWRDEWGGEFAVYDTRGNPTRLIVPVPGRLVMFENTDLAYHGVVPVSRRARNRVHVSASLLAPARPTDTRERALFLPTRLSP